MTHFFITLPSNSCMDYYKKNTPQSFKVKLTKPLDFTGKAYEVGLAEIQYPHTWHTISKFNNFINIIASFEKNTPPYITTTVLFPFGMYSSIDELITAINVSLEEKTNYFLFVSNPHTLRTRIRIKQYPLVIDDKKLHIKAIQFSAQLSRILGFKEATIIDYKKSNNNNNLNNDNEEILGTELRFVNNDDGTLDPFIVSPYPADIKRGMYSLFVYSDIVGHQIVGDTHTPLLRTVPIENKLNTVISKSFAFPDYLPVSSQIIDTIEIQIRDDTGTPVKFGYGKVLIKLHFRLKRSPYFE